MTIYMKQKLERGAGILMPISALPSPYGIGTLGKESYRFADFLERVGCRYWQVLPVGPTSFGDSPYQSVSAFSGNPYFIDLDYLVEEKLLLQEEVNQYQWQKEEDSIDYSMIYNHRFDVLKLAFKRSNHRTQNTYREFCKKNEYWLEDYSLYMAIKTHFDHKEWLLWEEDIRYRKKEAVTRYKILLQEDIDFWKFCQYKFREQWDQLKAYVSSKKIHIIGDIPIYVALDSADVWVHGDLFELDERKNPIHVAGVPPDAFSEDGQRWGNPLYRWDVIEKQEFSWWKERMKLSASLYDIIRIDHFIGVVNYYSIPITCPTAAIGEWRKGPGKKLTDAILESIGSAKIIAEDLGVVTSNVKKLMKETGFPGMKILEFSLDGSTENDNLPHNYPSSNLVVYTGTHDNETLVGFLKEKPKHEILFACKYFNVTHVDELPNAMMRALYSCIADVAMVQMQDILKLDNKARMNFPSTIGTNWKWRLKKNQYADINEVTLLELAILYNRVPKVSKE
ncbi:MAG: malQ [Herbinix sp.]|jgi:4-alpha-glucanotransferase|nr:malQ [Herbinix sp.]